MFTKDAILEPHTTTHERLDLLLRHVATVPDALCRRPISGFGHPTVWKQLVHILTCEEGWLHDLRNEPFDGWSEEDCSTMAALQAAKVRIQKATQAYVGSLTEVKLNTTLAQATGGLGRGTAQSGFHPVARHNPRVPPQRPGGRDAANSRISGSGYGSAARVDSLGKHRREFHVLAGEDARRSIGGKSNQQAKARRPTQTELLQQEQGHSTP